MVTRTPTMSVGACHAASTCCKAVTQPLSALCDALFFIERPEPNLRILRPRLPERPPNPGCRACGLINHQGSPPIHLDKCITHELRTEINRIRTWLDQQETKTL